jgi:hypothetical protein
MTWLKLIMWVLLAGLVIVVLGSYVKQWYVAQRVDSILAGNSNEIPVKVQVKPIRSVSQHERELMHLDTGFVADD